MRGGEGQGIIKFDRNFRAGTFVQISKNLVGSGGGPHSPDFFNFIASLKKGRSKEEKRRKEAKQKRIKEQKTRRRKEGKRERRKDEKRKEEKKKRSKEEKKQRRKRKRKEEK